MESLLERSELYLEKYERHISSAALIGGFIFDSLTLRSVDLPFENLTILSYLVISGGGILLLNYFSEREIRKTITLKVYKFLPLFIQFSFGALFSAYFIFYSRSGTIGTSWLFIFILLGLLVGNEFFKDYYQKLTFQVSLFFVAIFSFSIFFVPVVIRQVGAWVFILSGLVSLLVIWGFSRLLVKVVPTRFKAQENNATYAIGAIFLIINALYFLNLIPPIPLALKDVGVYHSIERGGDSYRALEEVSSWNKLVSFFRTERIHVSPNDSVYVFSSVFAPTDIDTVIVHDWQYLDEERLRWVSTSKISFNIEGGRREGYRGFTEKDALTPGKWRVDVKTERGQVLGRIRFNVREGAPAGYREKIL